MKIVNVSFVAGLSSYYFDDQSAIKQGAKQDGFIYLGQPVTPGFNAVRQRGEVISVILQLENGQYAVGDCCAVQYSGAGGRDPLFLAEHYLRMLDRQVKPMMIGMDARNFLSNSRKVESLRIDDQVLHTAIRYGISQALLEAAALSSNRLKVEVICDAYDLAIPKSRVALFAQSGDDRYASVDKMLMKRVDALPHGLINNIPDKLGYQGEKLIEYIQWIVSRVDKVALLANLDDGYKPDLHIDVYGTIGKLFEDDLDKIDNYLRQLKAAAGDLNLYVEGPIDMGSVDAQINVLGQIKDRIDRDLEGLFIVADEWCNTKQDIVNFVDAKCCHMVQIKTPDLGCIHNVVEAVLYCKEKGVAAYQGGTCNETDVSARACVHIAMASQPARLLVKPGMGFDEGMHIVNNEMERVLAMLEMQAPDH